MQSPIHTLKVVDVPYVQRLELEYHFPAYTGLEPQKIEDGGDIAVLRGTEVQLHVFPTMKTPGGRIALNDKDSVDADAAGRRLAHGVVQGRARRLLSRGARGAERRARRRRRRSTRSTCSTISAPTVSFNRPGRDTSVSSIEEVFVEANAEDDFGVRNLELVYSVNGGPEKVVKLFDGHDAAAGGDGRPHVLSRRARRAAGRLGVVLRARDGQRRARRREVRRSSDLYFLRIRPFKKDFRQAQSQGGGGGGGGGGAGQVEALSEQQRQIISATFNVQRDRKTLTPQKLQARTPRSWRCRSRGCASRSKVCSRA